MALGNTCCGNANLDSIPEDLLTYGLKLDWFDASLNVLEFERIAGFDALFGEIFAFVDSNIFGDFFFGERAPLKVVFPKMAGVKLGHIMYAVFDKGSVKELKSLKVGRRYSSAI